MKVIKKIKEKAYPQLQFFLGVFFIVLADLFDLYQLLVNQTYKLLEYWEIKVVAGSALAYALTFHETNYAYIAQSISWLLILDIFTKSNAISNQVLLEKGFKQEHISTFNRIQGWSLAFQEGRLTSMHCWGGIVTKAIQYGIVIYASIWIDQAFVKIEYDLPIKVIVFSLVWCCFSELISILENLRDAGVHKVQILLDLINNNLLNRLKGR